MNLETLGSVFQEAGLLNKSSCLAPTLGVTNMNPVTVCCAIKSDLDIQQTRLWLGLKHTKVSEKWVKISSSFAAALCETSS
jgi:hypothetical protein